MSPAALPEGFVISARYEVLATLGKGGMGVVYKARDRVLNETVALKVLRPDVADSLDVTRRFLAEIKLARSVSHKNVCRLHEYGEDGDLRYISMAFVDGVDLKRVLRDQGALPPERAFEIAIQVVEGLQAIHEEGIIHRDLKTTNIMLDARGVVRLMDFGIAKQSLEAAGPGVTQTGMIVGTPEYMSPEQVLGQRVDFRSDIYALGIVIYELFTGNTPFHADTPVATLMKHLHDPPPLEGPEAERLPAAVLGVLSRALAKDREDRYPSAAALLVDLRAAREAWTAPMTVPSRAMPPPTTALRAPGTGATTRPGAATTARGPGPTLPARAGGSTSTARLDADGTRTEAAPTLRAAPGGHTLVLTAVVAAVVAVVAVVVLAGAWQLFKGSASGGGSTASSIASPRPGGGAAGEVSPAASSVSPSAGPVAAASPLATSPPRTGPASASPAPRPVADRRPGGGLEREPPSADTPSRAGAAPPSAEVLGLIAEAEGAFASQQYDLALSFYGQALKLDPRNERARIGKDLCVKALAEAPAASMARHTFTSGKTAYTPGQAKAPASGPAGFESSAGVAVRRVDQPPGTAGALVFEVEPPEIKVGEAYTVKAYLVNDGGSPIVLADATVTSTVDGRPVTGAVALLAREVAPRQRALVFSATERWRAGTASWALSLAVRTTHGETYRNDLTWR